MGHFDKLQASKIEGELSLANGSITGFKKATVTTSLDAASSGKTVIIGPAAAGLAGDIIITLPSAADGLFFRFVYVGGAADAQDFQLNTGSDTNFFIGGVVQNDTDDGGDDTAVFHPDLNSNSRINFLTPDSGTWAECFCDGTNWFINACLVSTTDTGVTFADQ